MNTNLDYEKLKKLTPEQLQKIKTRLAFFKKHKWKLIAFATLPIWLFLIFIIFIVYNFLSRFTASI